MKRTKLLTVGLTVLILLLLPAQSMPLRICIIRGNSMDPGMQQGEVYWLDGVTTRKRDIQRGEVIVFRQDGGLVVKRVMGIPGDVMREHLNHAQQTVVSCCRLDSPNRRTWRQRLAHRHASIIVKLGVGEYYVLGDNLEVSLDSRCFGPIPARDIVGVLRPLRPGSVTEALNDWLAPFRSAQA